MPFWVWIVAFILITSTLNIIGLKVADRTNFVLMTFQLLILAIFVALSIAHLVSHSQTLVSTTPFTRAASPRSRRVPPSPRTRSWVSTR